MQFFRCTPHIGGKLRLLCFPQARRQISRSPPHSIVTKRNLSSSNLTATQFGNETMSPRRKRIVVSITGATGVALGMRLLQILKELGIETHLIISKWGLATMKYETNFTLDDLHSTAAHVYSSRNVAAPISSGSFLHDGMIVVPCSMKTLAAISCGYTEDLIVRAADVTLKEKRKLLIVPRETPLSEIHLRNMLTLARMGVIIFPPVPAFYTKPVSVDDIIEQSCGRILDCFGIHTDTFNRWNGF